MVHSTKVINQPGVLDLTKESVRRSFGVTAKDLVSSGQYSVTQGLAETARARGYEAVLVPSAANASGMNLIVFR